MWQDASACRLIEEGKQFRENNDLPKAASLTETPITIAATNGGERMYTIRFLVVALALLAVGTASMAQTIVTPTPLPDGVVIQERHLTLPSGPPDYSNTTTQTGYYNPAGAGIMAADDVHRITSLDLATIGFAYFSTTATGTVDATLGVFENNADDTWINPIANFGLTGLPVNGAYAFTVDIGPLAAPQDLWIGLAFSDDNTGLLTYNPPTVGTSHDLWAEDTDGDGVPDSIYWFGGDPVGNFFLETYPVPEPGSLLALGSGLLGLAALYRRRR